MRVRDVYARGSTAQMDWVIFMPSRRDGGEGERARGRARGRVVARAPRSRDRSDTSCGAVGGGVCLGHDWSMVPRRVVEIFCTWGSRLRVD